jgi:hypothetical protein
MRVVDVNKDALARATYDWEEKASIAQLMDLNCYVNDMRSLYGIQLYPLDVRQAVVVDHNKYLMFLLKWG